MAKTIKKNSVGAPDKYITLCIDQKLIAIQGWIMQGNTDEDIAAKLGVTRHTLINWKGRFPRFKDCFTTTKDIRLGELIHSAFKQATGYDYEEDVATKEGGVVTLRKHQPGNATLVMFMLQNHLPDEYKDRRNIDVTSKGKQIQSFSPLIQVCDSETKELFLNGRRPLLEANNDIQTELGGVVQSPETPRSG